MSSTETRTRRHVRRVVCLSSDVVETRRRIRKNGGRIVLSSPIGLDSYAIDYVMGA